MKNKVFIIIILFVAATKGFSQNGEPDSSENTGSINGIIHSLYNIISGPVGQERDWDAFRDLFAEDATMYIAVPEKDGSSGLKTITPDDYISRNKTRMADIGFNEKELYRIANTYGAGTQVFSTYESNFTDKNGEEEITKGINNIQLYFNGERYFIVSIFWDANAKNIEVPERYLPKNKDTEYQINL